jgi:hypothetical protein
MSEFTVDLLLSWLVLLAGFGVGLLVGVVL